MQRLSGIALVIALVALLALAGALVEAAPRNNQNPAMVAAPPGAQSQGAIPGIQQPEGKQRYGQLPLYFIKNRGQVDQEVQYYCRGRGQTTFFTKKEMVIALRRPQGQNPAAGPGRFLPGDQGRGGKPSPARVSVVTMQPLGMKKDLRLATLYPQKHKVNYCKGNDPKKWRTNIPTFKAVVYREAYPGIDLKFYGQGRQLEYDVIVKPGADPGQVRFAYKGVEKMAITPEGDLALHLAEGGLLVQRKPAVYQVIAGQRLPREGRFRLDRDGAALSCGFSVAVYDPRHPLVIDPIILDYSTCLGGDAGDSGMAIALDKSDFAYVVGTTSSDNFPTRAAHQTYQGSNDVFVTRLAPAGNSLVYSTYLGGDGNDYGNSIAVDASGNAYVTGYTLSNNFPTLNPYQGYQGSSDAFVTKLSPTGVLLYSTYLGGEYMDYGQGIAVDASGQAYVTGSTYSWRDFPITEYAFQEDCGGDYDAFVTKLSTAGNALVYSTYLGGKSYEEGRAIAVDSSGHAYVTGGTASDNFPSQNPYQSYQGYGDAFVVKLNPNGDALIYSTCLGGTYADKGMGLAVDQSGNAYVTGWTTSLDFPTQNAYQIEKWGQVDAFVTKLAPAGNTLVYSTYLGGSADDEGMAIALGINRTAYVVGITKSGNFPKRHYYQTFQGNADVFVTKLYPEGNDLVFSTFLGGFQDDYGYGIAVDGLGYAYVTGQTSSPAFPIKTPYMGYWGGSDAFVSKFREKSDLSYGALLLLLVQ